MSDSGKPTPLTPAHIAALDAFIFDLDGVIWRGETAIEGAAEAVTRLREAGKRCLFCTNNSSKSVSTYADRLRGMGIAVEDNEVLTSAWATATYLRAQHTGPFSVFVVGEIGIREALQDIGARVVLDHDVDDDTAVDCVVVGIDRAFTYERLRLAQRLIMKGATFIATNRDTTFPLEDGVVPGAGAVVAAVEAASGVTPVNIGKPRPAIIQLALEQFDIEAGTAALVGDRLDTDIAAAHAAGILALFVATGVTTVDQARRSKGDQRPHALFPDLTALCHIALGDDTPRATAAPVATQPATIAATADEATTEATTDEAEPTPATETVLESISEATAEIEAPVEAGAAVTDDETSGEVSAEPTTEPAATASGFNFALDDSDSAAAEPTPSTPTSAPVAEAAPIAATPIEATPIEATAADATTEEEEEVEENDWDFSELEGIDWDNVADEKNAAAPGAAAAGASAAAAPAKPAPAATTPATATPAKTPPAAKKAGASDDPFSSWFESSES